MRSKKITPDKILKQIKDEKINFVDFRFTDSLGKFHHVSYRSSVVEDMMLDNGITFDSSSIAGWKQVNELDMIMKPDLTTAFIDPFSNQSTLVLICDVLDPTKSYSRDPRSIGKKAESHLAKLKYSDKAYFGPEIKFFLFDDARFHNQGNESGFTLDSEEGSYNSNKKYEASNLGNRAGFSGGYATVSPVDSLNDIRNEMVLAMEEVGLKATLHYHDIAESQSGIGIEYAQLVKSADNVQKFKYVVKNVAASYGKTATFMPKPIYGDNGSGMHTNISMWKEDKNLFYEKGKYAELSERGLYFIGGIIKHAKAINAFSNPTTNSYKRLIPGAPTLLAYSAVSRITAMRIPKVFSFQGKRIEVCFPDPAANPYLSFSAILLAGLDGIKNKIHPGSAINKELDHLSERELANISEVSMSLRESLEALDRDREFLLEGGVFDHEVINAYIDLKIQEIREWETRPHPIEFKMYYSL
jgi:glutamine synthetase